jgi:hypothetical protein
VYGTKPADGLLSLRAHGLFFTDPHGVPREYHIDPLATTR